MSTRAAAAWLALALIVGGLIAGLVPVHANDVSCGSAFTGENSDASTAQYGDDLKDVYAGLDLRHTDFEADCSSRRGTQWAFVIPPLVIGILGGGFLLLTTDPNRTRTAAPRKTT